MAQSAVDKIPPGAKLDALTAEKVFGWKNVHKHDGALVGKRQDKAGHWRRAKVPNYSTNPLHAYSVENRMEQLGRTERYQKESPRSLTPNIFLLTGLRRINVAGLPSKLWDSTVKSFR
jgi:hypothetical protein